MLVGDINQLPSVGAGNVLRDVIDSGLAHVTRLETIFRQGEDSYIVVNAHRINHGELPFMDNSSSDFYFFGADEPAQTADLVVDIVQNRLPKKFGCDPIRDIQVIAPMYRGPAGVDSLNDMLQRALNGSNRKAEKNFGGKIFRAGDKVMQTRNNYDKDVFNGDIGMIRGFDFDEDVMQVVMEDGMIVEYDWTEVEQLRHAFCISTHRSQGSEYGFVVIPVLTQHYMMLQRNLLYTAITRAKKVVVLVGSRKAVAMAVGNNKVESRYSGLLPRLKGHVVVSDSIRLISLPLPVITLLPILDGCSSNCARRMLSTFTVFSLWIPGNHAIRSMRSVALVYHKKRHRGRYKGYLSILRR
jgi:exodeoxyribonuclease V alpha subunit